MRKGCFFLEAAFVFRNVFKMVLFQDKTRFDLFYI